MAQYNFEGDLENIAERQLEFINSVIVEYGFKNSKVNFTAVGNAGDNYASCIKRITIEGDNRNLTMIAKIAPSHEAIRQTMNSSVLFKNEQAMYFEVLPRLVQLQKDAGIPEEDQLKFAKCYGSFGEQPHEVILLEDLKLFDFTLLDRFKYLSNDCIKSVLKNFAVLHSLSYVLNKKEPNVYSDFKTNLTDAWNLQANTKEMKMFFQTLENDTLLTLEEPDHINFVRQKIVNSLEMSSKLANDDIDNRYAVILQGDAWTNNIMFRFENEKLAESIMIDYQLSRNASPVFDIMYLLFNCTDHETRRQYYHIWIDYYHSELEKSLSNFKLDVNFMYPREILNNDLKRYGIYMFGMSVCLTSLLIRKSDDAAKVMEAITSENIEEHAQKMGIEQLDDESKVRFKNRIIGLINSFNEFGLA